jgi:hypothetical protein
MSNTPSLEDIRIVSCGVEEIVLRDQTPESEISSASSTLTRKNSEDYTYGYEDSNNNMGEARGMARDIFSGRTIFMDALERHDDHHQHNYVDEQREGELIQRYDTMKSVYVDALEDEEPIQVKETMEIAVVAEIHDGLLPPRPVQPPFCHSWCHDDGLTDRLADYYRG